MAETTHPIHRSQKPVKTLSEVVGKKTFFFPKKLANDNNSEGKPCIRIQIGRNIHFIPTETETDIPYECFCLLKDIGVIKSTETFAKGEEFDPLLKGGVAPAYQ